MPTLMTPSRTGVCDKPVFLRNVFLKRLSSFFLCLQSLSPFSILVLLQLFLLWLLRDRFVSRPATSLRDVGEPSTQY